MLNLPSLDAEPTEENFQLANLMVATMESKNGIGLAAVQVGFPIKLIVIKLSSGGVIKMLNPKIIDYKGKLGLKEEGCLSFPKQFTFIKRYTSVLCEYYNMDTDSTVRRLFTHRDAHVIQHELDHLLGKTIPDRLLPAMAKQFIAKFNAYEAR